MVTNQTECSRLEKRFPHHVANYVKFTKECVMCMEKHVLIPKIYKRAKHESTTTKISRNYNPLNENTLSLR